MSEEFAVLVGGGCRGEVNPTELPTEDLFCDIAKAPNITEGGGAATSVWPRSNNMEEDRKTGQWDWWMQQGESEPAVE